MKPFLFRFKENIETDSYPIFYDSISDMSYITFENKTKQVIDDSELVLGTKRAKLGDGEDQKATLFGP